MKDLRELLVLQLGEKTGEYAFKNFSYLEHGDKYIEIGSKKPTITKTFWYDDERPAPEIDEEYFIDGNLSNNRFLYELDGGRGTELYVIEKYYNDRTNGRVCGLTYLYEEQLDRIDYIVEKVTPELLEKINAGAKVLELEFIERLKRYWKRYSKHVRACGYWVNR